MVSTKILSSTTVSNNSFLISDYCTVLHTSYYSWTTDVGLFYYLSVNQSIYLYTHTINIILLSQTEAPDRTVTPSKEKKPQEEDIHKRLLYRSDKHTLMELIIFNMTWKREWRQPVQHMWPWTTKAVLSHWGCSNSQKYIVYVKIIDFSFMQKKKNMWTLKIMFHEDI